MNRIIVYPGAIPQDSDILWTERYTEIALGMVMRAAFGTSTVIDGLTVAQQASPNMTVQVGQGAIITQTVIDPTGVALGSLPADTTTNLVKIGINTAPTNMSALVAPPVSGQSQNWLVQAQFLEQDTNPTALPYYNAANPNVPYTGPANSGTAQNTLRSNTVQLQWKGGVAATTGQQNTPTPDAGWVGVAIVTVANGQGSITTSNITPYSSAPIVPTKLAFQRIRLTAPLTVYCSPFGSDTANSGLSAASPFLTMQKAWGTVINNYDLNGYVATIQLANGTYTAPLNATGTAIGGQGYPSVVVQGNMGSPSSVVINVANASCITAQNGGNLTIQGVTLQNSGTGAVVACLNANTFGQIGFGTVVFGASVASHIVVGNGGIGVATGNYSISGNAPGHWFSGANGTLYTVGVTVTLTGTPAFASAFCTASSGNVQCGQMTFTGSATGTRFTASGNGVIITSGGGANYLPGSIAGSVPNTWQYN